jgi:lipopolysaccharide transport system ATP-binding protein
MSEAIISVEGLGKKYRISHQRQNGMRYKSLRDVIAEKATRLFRGRETETGDRKPEAGGQTEPSSDLRPPSSEDFWALRDVSFEVKQGDVVGIIGRNGAGKSTLLKILSRITEPTEGEVRIKGRVASLLEVGTGFHPELTGRENVFLNGAILGMSRVEIRQKFDEIVAFAEVEKFLDTPVKRYSSGMYVRLAFAVAAHLEPEILVVDEVLAVGDGQFQQKCLGKMQEVSQGGRTVLFVSHNMLAVQKLCGRGLLLESGHLKLSGPVKDIVESYISMRSIEGYTKSPSEHSPRIIAAKVLTLAPRTDTAFDLEVEWHLPERIPGIKIGIGLNTLEGQRVFDSVPEDIGLHIPEESGHRKAVLRIPPNTLMARHYIVSLGLWVTPSGGSSTVFDRQDSALSFSVESGPGGPYGHQATRDGLVHIDHCKWIIQSSGA